MKKYLVVERYEGDNTEQTIHPFNNGDNFEELVTARFNQLIDHHHEVVDCELEFFDCNSEAYAEHDDFSYRWELVAEDKPFSEIVKAA